MFLFLQRFPRVRARKISGKGSYKTRKVFRRSGARIRGRGTYFGVPMKERTATLPLSFNGDGRGGCRIRHSEYLQDCITSSTVGAFQNEGMWLINPGNPETFPWLWQIATQFEEFEFHGLVFEFKSTSADALGATNTALGVTIGATDYNVTHQPFPNKQAADNYEWTVSGRPSLSHKYPVECKPSMNVLNHLYVSSATAIPTTGNQDPRLTWLGGFQFMTQGFQAASVNIGELWVHYDVCLYKPASGIVINNVTGGNAGWSQFEAATTMTGTNVALTGQDNNHFWGNQSGGYTFTSFGTAVSPALQGSENSIYTTNWNQLQRVSFINGTGTASVVIWDQSIGNGSRLMIMPYIIWSVAGGTAPDMGITTLQNAILYFGFGRTLLV